MSGTEQAIIDAATKHGVDPNTALTIFHIEDPTGDPAAKNPSGATGIGQFMPATARQYGLADRTDVAASADAMARYIADNNATLTRALGRPPTVGETYLAYQQGASGALRLLANPNAPASSVVGSAAVTKNVPVSMRAQAANMTAGQFANIWADRAAQVASTIPPASIPGGETSAAQTYAPGSSPAAPASIADLYGQHSTPVPLAPLAGQPLANAGDAAAFGSPLAQAYSTAPAGPMGNAGDQLAFSPAASSAPATPLASTDPATGHIVTGQPTSSPAAWASQLTALYSAPAAASSLLSSVASGSITGTVKDPTTGASVPTAAAPTQQSALTSMFNQPNRSGSPDERQAANDARNASIQYTGQGIAGTVQLPADVRPNIPSTSSNSGSAQGSTIADNGGWGAYASPPASSLASLYGTDTTPYNAAPAQPSAPAAPTYAEHQVTTSVQKPNPAYQAWEADQSKAAMYGVEGVPTPTLDASGNVTMPSSYLGASPPPPKFITVPHTTTVRVPVAAPAAPAPAPQVVAPSPIQQLYGAPNGYVYQSNGNGGYTNVGTSMPNLTPSQQYAKAAQAAGGVAQGYAPAGSNNSHGYSGFGSGI